ncbi:thioredoxin family protein [Pseudooceanicola sp. CBS1P-1]|uniref:Thioredoxin n=1 Tax=Pseudooceanicola albus TaxID=2692189 RepID=A0A6L7FXS8_9RHOB|nr:MULTISPECIES: thioredoxin family protein [Pseudooceanicola]MBT9383946.1 thioredoxin family protein [Pseudooceanicola endophyticus]MXN16641.1 thioredoxin [Pseudooceanicola albus]
MDRRLFLASGPALALAATLPGALRAAEIDYAPGLIGERLDRGEVLLLDFFAPWCTTCAAQQRVIEKLKAENPAYGRAITFIKVDWDTYGQAQFARRMRIPRRSTLVVLKGKDELGRLVAETRESQIRALLDTALAAAGS